MADRPANKDNSIVAKSYFVNDLQMNYTKGHYSYAVSIQNLFNANWKETQFATESRLKGEAEPVEKIWDGTQKRYTFLRKKCRK